MKKKKLRKIFWLAIDICDFSIVSGLCIILGLEVHARLTRRNHGVAAATAAVAAAAAAPNNNADDNQNDSDSDSDDDYVLVVSDDE